MKQFIFILSLVLFSMSIFAQDDEPVYYYANYTSDWTNLSNKNYTYFSCYLGQIDLTVEVNTEQSKLWKNGKFYATLLNNHGAQPTTQWVGDIQVFSNIEAPTRTKLYELWYEHTFADKLSIKLGQQNINSEFVYSEYGLNFISSAFGVIPAVSSNIPVSIFPNTALGARIIYKINNQWDVRACVTDGNPGDETNDPFGIHWTHKKGEGIIAMGEVVRVTEKDSTFWSSYKIGYWYSNSEFQDLVDPAKVHKVNYGFYFMGDQMLFPEANDKAQGLGAFAQASFNTHRFNTIKASMGGGICYTGLCKKRPDDVLSVGYSNVLFTEDVKNMFGHNCGEHVIEANYSINFNDNITLQPDLQYIVNTGGEQKLNTLIGLIRLKITFDN